MDQFNIESERPSVMESQEYEYQEIQTDNSVVNNDQQFRMELKDTSSFTNLNRGYLQVRFKLETALGVDFAGNDNVALNSSIGTLFSRAVLRINNMVVESTDNCHLVNALKPIVLYSRDYSESTSTNEMFYLHSGDALDSTITPYAKAGATINDLVISDNTNYNQGHAKARARLNNSSVVTAIIPLENLVDFASVDRVITNCNVALELTRSQPSYHLFSDGVAAAARVNVLKMSLWLPRIVPQPELEMELKSQFAAGVVSNFRFSKWNGYLPTPVARAGTHNIRVATMSERVLGVFIQAKASAITQQVNSNKTENVLTDVFCRLNGKQYPNRSYSSLKVDDSEKSRAYLQLLDYQSRGADVNSGVQLSRRGWDNQSIYYVNTEAQQSNDSKSPTTVEVQCTTDGACQLHIVLVTEKQVSISYAGSQPQVTTF